MPLKVPGRRGGTINRWVKGESGNPKGKVRKYVSTLKNMGYNLYEINDTIQNIIAMDLIELEQVYKSESSTILEKIIAKALEVALKKGDLTSIETLLNRVYGKPMPPKSPDDGGIPSEYRDLTDEERFNRIRQILKPKSPETTA